MKFFIKYIIIVVITFKGWSQDITDADAFFLKTRDMAFAGHWKAAQDSLEHLLQSYPTYSDAKILLGKTYSWSGDYEKARRHLNRVTSVEKERRDAWLAAIKNELYAKNLNIAIGLANKALVYLDRDDEIEQLKLNLIAELLTEKPIQQKLKEENREEEDLNRIGVSTGIEIFDMVFDPTYQTSITYQKQTTFGKVLPRITYANRFNTTGAQFEVDVYPTISKTFHGYFNYGYSPSLIFPKHRLGIEMYAELPKAIEVSLGSRHMRFDNVNVSIVTSSFGMYRGNYYLSARPFVAFRSDKQIGLAGTILARKYGRDGNNYFGVRGNYGFDSELNQFIVDGVLLSETQLFVESQQLQLEYQFSNQMNTHIYTVNAGVRRQELFFAPNTFFWAVSAGLRYQFNF